MISDDSANELSDAPADVQEAADDVIERGEVITDQVVVATQEGLAQLASDVEATQQQIEQLAFASPAVQQAQTEPISSDQEGFREEFGDATSQLEQMIDNLTARLEAIANRPNASADQQWNLQSYLIGVLGVAVPAGAAIIYEIITRFANNQSAADVPGISDEDKARIQAFVQSLQQVNDHTYWASVLAFVANNNPTNAASSISCSTPNRFFR